MKRRYKNFYFLFLISILVQTLSSFASASLKDLFYHSPPELRVCCGFGYDLELPLIPFLTISNTVELHDLFNEHTYGGSFFEDNGVVYTCRGGFIDTGHLRDVADWTAYLAPLLKKQFGLGQKTIRLPNQGTEGIKIVLTPRNRSPSDETFIQLAQRIAFEYSTWHEIATWYGYRFFPLFPEKVSAFSPEDFYSNLLGTYVGAWALQRGGSYETAAGEVLKTTFRMLGALNESQTRRVFDLVVGHWWQRGKTLVDNEQVIRRYLDYGETFRPWLVPKKVSECDSKNTPPFFLELPKYDEEGHALSSYYRLVFLPKSDLDLPKPHYPNRYLMSDDFAWVLNEARYSVRGELGLFADQPDF